MRTLVLLLGLVATLAGCGREPVEDAPPPPIDPGTFADVLAELAVARIETLPDTASYRRRRAEILDRAGVTESELRAFAASQGGDPDLMSAIYGRVGARIDSHAQVR